MTTKPIPKTMRAMVTMGHGGLEQIVQHNDWACPQPATDEVLIEVRACGLNNTDINTRAGWYSKAVTTATNDDAPDLAGAKTHHGAAHR